MILEARLRDDIFIQIDAPATSGIEKGGVERSYPDQALDNMLILAGQMTSRLKELTQGEDAPDSLEVTFGVRVDGNAAVSIARDVASAQLQVTARWTRD
ncbi:MAG: hypothetical protein ACI8S6_005537 [Myxococcota bacterium]|jgi:hypothetical protein